MYKYAITRKPCQNFSSGLTSSNLGIADYQIMLKQHDIYIQTLKSLGLKVINLEPLDNYPDAHFVEDTAVVIREAAIITRPGTESRRGEEKFIEPQLAKYKSIFKIEDPGTLDGGDILITEAEAFIGVSNRTNKEGAEQLSDILLQYGYSPILVKVEEGLHLKSDINYMGKSTLIITEKYLKNPAFKNYKKICVNEKENYAANSLSINDKVLIPKGFPKIKQSLEKSGMELIELDMSESQKMDGGLTCLSLRF